MGLWLVRRTRDLKDQSSSPAAPTLCVFTKNNLLSQCLSPPTCINGNQQIAWEQPDKILGGNLQWTSIPSRGSRNTPSRFILQKPEISTGTDEPLARPITIGTGFTLLGGL